MTTFVSPVTWPDWYDPAKSYNDPEFLLKNYFQGLLPSVTCLSWFPLGDEILQNITQNNTIYLRIFRVGGTLAQEEDGRKSFVDNPRIQFAAIAAQRTTSVQVITFVRMVLWQYYLRAGRMSAAGIYAMVNTIGEVEGPQLTPLQFRDERLVPVTFDLAFQMPKGLPDYRIPLGL